MRKIIPRMLSLKEAAEIMGISKQRLWQWIKGGQFPLARRVGHLWKIPEDELREFLELEQTVGEHDSKRVTKRFKREDDDSRLLRNIWLELIRLRKLLEKEVGKSKKKSG